MNKQRKANKNRNAIDRQGIMYKGGLYLDLLVGVQSYLLKLHIGVKS